MTTLFFKLCEIINPDYMKCKGTFKALCELIEEELDNLKKELKQEIEDKPIGRMF